MPDPASGLIEDERDRVLWRAFHQLGDRCRELLRVVAMVERPDYAVVGEALGMPHGSIGPTRGRCLAKLRALLLRRPDLGGAVSTPTGPDDTGPAAGDGLLDDLDAARSSSVSTRCTSSSTARLPASPT